MLGHRAERLNAGNVEARAARITRRIAPAPRPWANRPPPRGFSRHLSIRVRPVRRRLESKELVGGFVLLQVPSFAAMLAFADRYGRILDEDVQLDLRQAEEPPQP